MKMKKRISLGVWDGSVGVNQRGLGVGRLGGCEPRVIVEVIVKMQKKE